MPKLQVKQQHELYTVPVYTEKVHDSNSTNLPIIQFVFPHFGISFGDDSHFVLFRMHRLYFSY